MSDKIRVEVTFNKEKHADILAAMKKYGNQAGFLKFAARYYIETIEKKTPSFSQEKSLSQENINSSKSTSEETRRRLPVGISNQAISKQMNE